MLSIVWAFGKCSINCVTITKSIGNQCLIKRLETTVDISNRKELNTKLGGFASFGKTGSVC